VLGAFGALACSAQVEETTSASSQSRLYARFVVSHTQSAGVASALQGDTVAGFVRIPNDVDSVEALQLLGLQPVLPEPGTCAPLQEGGPTPSQALQQLQLLDAGDVNLEAAQSRSSLAPRAFPGLLGGVSGVLYTSRERDAAEVPFDTEYKVTAAGAADVPAVTLNASAPQGLSEVRVQGSPLAELSRLRRGAPVDLTWAVGAPGDRLWLQLTDSKSGAAVLCTFEDAAGTGTVPASSVTFAGEGTLALHRYRTVKENLSDSAEALLAFDFSLSRNVTLADGEL